MNANPEMLSPMSPGAQAPDFALPAVDGSGTVSLQDYRGKTPLFLALFIGLWCPFCRRSIAEMAATEPALKAQGVETLCVVATPPDNARLYFKYRPTRLRLAADPELTTHRAYGVPKPAPTPELMTGAGDLSASIRTAVSPSRCRSKRRPRPSASSTATSAPRPTRPTCSGSGRSSRASS